MEGVPEERPPRSALVFVLKWRPSASNVSHAYRKLEIRERMSLKAL
jgi:hypothetical protein